MGKFMTFLSLTILISAAIYLLTLSANQKLLSAPNTLNDYQARKEDLLASQEKLAIQIQSLNQTIQQEMLKQEQLKNQLATLSDQAAASNQMPNQTTTTKKTTTTRATTTRATTTTVWIPVTRAS